MAVIKGGGGRGREIKLARRWRGRWPFTRARGFPPRRFLFLSCLPDGPASSYVFPGLTIKRICMRNNSAADACWHTRTRASSVPVALISRGQIASGENYQRLALSRSHARGPSCSLCICLCDAVFYFFSLTRTVRDICRTLIVWFLFSFGAFCFFRLISTAGSRGGPRNHLF